MHPINNILVCANFIQVDFRRKPGTSVDLRMGTRRKLDFFPQGKGVLEISSWISASILVFLMCADYHRSLSGSTDVDGFHDMLPAIVQAFTRSCIFFVLSVICVYYSPIPYPRRNLAWVLLLLITLWQMLSDTGSHLDSHGTYNAVAFVFMTSLMLLAALLTRHILKIALRSSTRALCVGLLLLLLCIPVRIKLDLIRFDIATGIDRSLVQPKCKIDYSTFYPWKDVFPYRTQTFWGGSDFCPVMSDFAQLIDVRKIRPSFTEYPPGTDVLIMNCTAETPGTYTILPELRGLTFAQKRSQLAATVRSKMIPQIYEDPVVVTNGEAVIAECGSERRYFSRLLTSTKADRLRSGTGQERRDSEIRQHRKLTVAKNKTVSAKPPSNVMIILIDALSRNQLHRMLPLTSNYLRSLKYGNSTSDVFELYRFLAVAQHTGPNTLAFMTGEATPGPETVPFWRRVYERDYLTSMFTGICENWGAHYARLHNAFDIEYGSMMCVPEYHDPVNPFGMTRGPYSVLRRCLGPDYVHQHVLDQAERHWTEYKDVNKFSLVYLLEAHEGTSNVIRLIESDLVRFLKKIDMENTAVIIMGDHGLHMGFAFIYTMQGDLEVRTPAFLAVIPKRITAAHPEQFANLQANQYAVTSMWDVYKTLIDLKSLSLNEALLSDEDKIGSSLEECRRRSSSLFDPLPVNRTCEQACVSRFMCVCGSGL